MGLIRVTIIAALFSFAAAAQTGIINDFAGNAISGAGYSGDGAAATQAQLTTPYGVAADSAGNVYIADFGNFVVRKVTLATGIITTVAGTGTQTAMGGFNGDGGVATMATLTGPTGVAVDSAGNLYIADGPANRIRKVSNSIITTIAGTGSGGSAGDSGPAISAQLNYPSGIAVDSSGNLYIADTGNHRIRKLTGTVITTIAGNGNFGYGGDGSLATSATLYSPYGVAVDALGNVYIADTNNNRIREISGGVINTIAGNGSSGYSGDKGAATSASISLPHGVAVDPSGTVYIADTSNNVIRKVASGVITTVAGTGAPGFGGDGIPAISSSLAEPFGIAVDPTGGFTYIADTGNNEIRDITNVVFSGVISQFATGQSYVTGFYVVNTGSAPAALSLSFFGDSGTAVSPAFTTLTGTASVTGSVLTDTIPALGSAYYEAGNYSSATLVEGSVLIQSNPGITVQAIYRHLSAAGIYYEAAIPSTPGATEYETTFDATTFAPTNAQIYTALAIVNIDPINTATVTCTTRSTSGAVISNAVSVPSLAPMAHWAAFNFPALTGLRGTIDCTSTTKIGMIGLRFLGNDALSSLPVILK